MLISRGNWKAKPFRSESSIPYATDDEWASPRALSQKLSILPKDPANTIEPSDQFGSKEDDVVIPVMVMKTSSNQMDGPTRMQDGVVDSKLVSTFHSFSDDSSGILAADSISNLYGIEYQEKHDAKAAPNKAHKIWKRLARGIFTTPTDHIIDNLSKRREQTTRVAMQPRRSQ